VAKVYRTLGNTMRAIQILEQLFPAATGSERDAVAELRGRMAVEQGHEDEAEGWLRKAGNGVTARTSLLEIEAVRLERSGKLAECAAKFAEVAKAHLAATGSQPGAGYNNAAMAYEEGFDCSGDPEALRAAERALETALRNEPDDVIVVSNLAATLESHAALRLVQRHIDTRALKLTRREVERILGALLTGPTREGELAALRADRGIRRSSELFAQAEVLAPSNIRLLGERFSDAVRRDDLATATALVDRVRHAKGLDVEDSKAARERDQSGADDAKRIAGLETRLVRLESIVAHPSAGLSANSRAAGWLLIADAASDLGRLKLDAALLARAREAATAAMQLWPALDCHGLLVAVLLDEAGVAADGKAWLAERRLRHPNAALAHLASRHAALADQIRGAKSWPEVADHARADTTRPGVGDLRLARLLGDAALETRTRAVLDDRMVHLGLELAVLFDPADEVTRSDLALLDAR